MSEEFEPRITAFVCNWCTYTGADLAGTSRLHMASNVRIIRLPCTGRIDPLFVIKAFERGADGVIVSGCHPADCHYTAGNYHARRRFALFHDLMAFIGVDAERITFSWVSASEGAKWRDVVNEAVANVRRVGPFTAYRELIDQNVSADYPLEHDEVLAAAAASTPATSGASAAAAADTSTAAAKTGEDA